MEKVTRRDFMRGVVGAGLGLGYFASVIDGSSSRRDVAWSEEVEDEARLRNEVGDLMRKCNVSVEYSFNGEEYGRKFCGVSYIDGGRISDVDIPCEKIVEIRNRIKKDTSQFERELSRWFRVQTTMYVCQGRDLS
ncbi:MAG: hypothetical protein V1889_02400 [archaeon]